MAKIRFFALLLIVSGSFLFVSVSHANAATYYIDYQSGLDSNSGTNESSPWKHHPWMQTFTGTYTHATGDIFVFKGGVTWLWTTGDKMFPLYVKAGGTSGNSDQYTVDKTWYSGSSWTRPIFDGGQQCGGSTTTLGENSFLIGDYFWNPSNVVINGLQLQNIGAPSDCSGTAVQFVGSDNNIEIENVIFNPYGLQAFAYVCGTGTCTGFSVHDSTIENAARSVIYGWSGALLNGVQIYGLDWQGPGSQVTTGVVNSGYHFDGLMIGCPTTCAADTITNISFHDNYFYGSWDVATAQYFSAGWTSNTTMYNNVFSLENTLSTCIEGTCLSPGFVVFGGNDSNISVYNNTFSSDINPGEGAGVNVAALSFGNSSGSIVVEGNIFSGTGMDVGINPVGLSFIVDYNVHNPSQAGSPSGYWVLNGWVGAGNFACTSQSTCASHGVETHGIGSSSYSSTYPGFISIPNGSTGSGNYQLQSSSPAIDAFPTAAAPTSLFTTDILGISRPQGSAWDIGAYEYAQATPPTPLPDTTPPAAPTGLVVI
jgi:hypothetical protein